MAKCSEETLRVLRANKESLLTILEVFIHDPLYKWQLTSQRAQQRQKGDASAQDDAGTLLLPLSSLLLPIHPCFRHRHMQWGCVLLKCLSKVE